MIQLWLIETVHRLGNRLDTDLLLQMQQMILLNPGSPYLPNSNSAVNKIVNHPGPLAEVFS